MNIDTTVNGDVWFRESTVSTLLQRANEDIRKAFPFLPQFTATHLFIVTWDSVGARGGSAAQVSRIVVLI